MGAEDGRCIEAIATVRGAAMVEAADPIHAAIIAGLVLDHLSGDQLAHLIDTSAALLRRCEHDAEPTRSPAA